MRLQQRFTLNGNDATFLMSLAVFIFSQLLIHADVCIETKITTSCSTVQKLKGNSTKSWKLIGSHLDFGGHFDFSA